MIENSSNGVVSSTKYNRIDNWKNHRESNWNIMVNRMKLIHEQKYLKLLRNQAENSVKQAAESKGDDASKILFDRKIPDDIKLAMYMKLVNEFKLKISEILNTSVPVHLTGETQPLTPEVQAKEKTFFDADSFDTAESEVYLSIQDKAIISMFPPTFQQRAEIVLKILKERPDLISWDKNGVITFFGDDLCRESSLYDLLNYLIRDLKWKVAPNGANRFLLICKKLGVPASILRNKLREQYVKALDNFSEIKSASDSGYMSKDNKHRLLHWSSLEDSSSEDADADPLSSTPNKKRRKYSS
ncbi:unnamed protein product [Orchesella dallaii]|uniref:Uncharacterized protein n=1 Tax=Orchesella dallaii TaxID=48710 RepID=A0ABP1RVP3_9HEXA